MTINSQLLKGTLDGAILIVISKGEPYGYEITKKLEMIGFLSIAAGTIYPILQKLEREAYITGDMKASSEGPKRKYFTITEKGLDKLHAFFSDWATLTVAMENLIQEFESGDDK